MSMRTIVFYVSLLAACLICGAKEIVIRPQYTVGDTLRYRSTTQMAMRHGNDSIVSLTTLLPEIIIEEKNDEGFVIKTSNRLEDYSIECSDSAAIGQIPSPTETLNDFVATVALNIQLDADCRPDSILNMAEVREKMMGAHIRMIAKQQGDKDATQRAEWETQTKPLIAAAVYMLYTRKHLIETQFSFIPYFNFTGIPLKSGVIPSSMVLADELQRLCPELKELRMEVAQSAEGCRIKVSGKKGDAAIEGELWYAAGILNHGFLSLTNKIDTGWISGDYTIEMIR